MTKCSFCAESVRLFLSLYVSGVVLSLKPPLGKWADQMIMSLAISFGTGIQLFLYLTELAARYYCPNENATWYDGLQLIDCYKQFNY